MQVPGPGGVEWGLALLAYGALLVGIGEPIRWILAPRVPLFRSPDWVERVLLDLYLGIGALYVVEVAPVPTAFPETPLVLLVLSVGSAVVIARRRHATLGRAIGVRKPTPDPTWAIIALALVLFGLELALAEGAPSGNTYDSSLYGIYSALTLGNHSLPWTLAPVVPSINPFPQGATAVFAGVQGIFGVPPPRTPLLVTPLFLAAVPFGAYVLGRRWLGSRAAGVAVALMLGLVASWPRLLAAGSNDFVLAFPAGLLLLGWAATWVERSVPCRSDAVAFGAVAGVTAALNPVAPEWVLLLVLLAKALAPDSAASPGWGRRWLTSVGVSLPFVAPSILAEIVGGGSGFGPPASSSVGFDLSRFAGWTDPFLFRPENTLLSPFPLLRAELAALLVLGVALALWPRVRNRLGPSTATFGRLTAAAIVAAIGALAVSTVTGVPILASVQQLWSPDELALWLFTVYAVIASLPLVLVFRAYRPAAPAAVGAAQSVARPRAVARARTGFAGGRAWTAGLVALVLLAPGIAVTATDVPSYVASTYRSFGNLTSADYAMLAWGAANLPGGQRILVAPGSAAQFLPAYDPSLVTVYPVLVRGESTNASYRLVVDELTNGTLDRRAVLALEELDVEYIAVTQQNSVLWRPFSPWPVLNATASAPVFHEGDAWIFQWGFVPS